ncbi:MAG: electron transport complex subunit RsxB [bacterium]|nr:electron transport complex subunit RsxB [bacterium]
MSLPSPRIPLVDQIEALLPQTQCGKCLHPGCRPYAEAMAQGDGRGEAINHCVPGGADTIAALAALLHTPVLPLDPAYGVEPSTRRIAFIREAECIGCTKCIQACPVDAILGAAKLMHTVIVDECTGCDLCVAPCPVDCIDMLDLPKVTDKAEKKRQADHARARYEFRNTRLAREKAELAAPEKTLVVATDTVAGTQAPAKPAGPALMIAAAMARTSLKKAERKLLLAQENGEDVSALQNEITSLQAEVLRLEAAQKN